MDVRTREQIQAWVAEFCLDDAADSRAPALREQGAGALVSWLEAACAQQHCEPEELELAALRQALLEHLARLELPAELHRALPGLCRELLARLEQQGRLQDGADLGASLWAMAPQYQQAVSGKQQPLRRPGSKLRRNDPCPCGSGRKYKRCCMGR